MPGPALSRYLRHEPLVTGAVYSFANRLTDDPRDAVALTRQVFNGARKQLQRMRNQTAIATVLIAAGPTCRIRDRLICFS